MRYLLFALGIALAPGTLQARPMLVLPVQTSCISSPFGPRVLPQHPQAGRYHYGVDLPAPEGAEVRAAATGTVIRIQHGGLGGLEMLVQHPGYVGVYSHLGAVAADLGANTRVVAGQKLGVVGHTGLTFGMHLYFEMIAGQPIDPAPYLGVPLCSGGSAVYHRPRTAEQILAAGDKLPPTKRYYLLDAVSGEH